MVLREKTGDIKERNLTTDIYGKETKHKDEDRPRDNQVPWHAPLHTQRCRDRLVVGHTRDGGQHAARGGERYG